MKNKLIKPSFILGFLFLLIACSTKKNSFISRNSHALSTEYNILYNGGIALEKGNKELKSNYKDNFWALLPIERMQINAEDLPPGETKNANFERAETKAIKAIQKHSMNIDGKEKNPQMDEAHLMLGKARYYDQRFVPALEAFNYILYKYPDSDKIYEAKIWREKTNIRMENDALAVTNLERLLKEIKFKNQIFADANAILAQAFLNLDDKACAIENLILAKDFTKLKEERARYHFILGQLYDDVGYKDSAYAAYQSVIDMKRKAPRHYVIQAYSKQALQFDFEKGDTIAFLKKFNKLLKDRENRPFLDVLNHQMGLFYDKNKKYDIAEKYYSLSLKSKSYDSYLVASNYRKLADLNFNKAKYQTAGNYYDSTLVQLNFKSREYKLINKKKENLIDVIKYEDQAKRNDSIINVVSMSEGERVAFYENYIVTLKKEDEIKKLAAIQLQKKSTVKTANIPSNLDENDSGNPGIGNPNMMPPGAQNSSAAVSDSDFYFYNLTTVAFGKSEFRKNWGERVYKNNWRLSTLKSNSETDSIQDNAIVNETIEKIPEDNEKYTSAYYINQLPKEQTAIDNLIKERNFAYYQLGSIYKEKFKEYPLAASKFEQLLKKNPEERLILPSMYNLNKIYEIIDAEKAQAIKDKIISEYPESRYAQILQEVDSGAITVIETPEMTYTKLYKSFESGAYRTVYSEIDTAIGQYAGEVIIPKFELLKANLTGKLKGVAEFRKALNFVALNYPYSEEGKQAEVLLSKDIPVLESFKFNGEVPKSWKILYKIPYTDSLTVKAIQTKIKKFIESTLSDRLTTSYDVYTMNDDFIVIHGIISEEYAKKITQILKQDKSYKISQSPVVISNYNYKIVQIKKNLEEYLSPTPVVPLISPSIVPTIVPVESPAPVNVKPEEPSQNENLSPKKM